MNMKKSPPLARYLSSALVVSIITFTGWLTPLYAQQAGLKQIPAEIVVDKIRGGLLGQILGNLNGIPHEFKYGDEPGQVKNYVPSLPDGARTDDDTDFEWVYIIEMQKNRKVFLPYDEIAALWKERINRNIWCANRYARHLMDMGFSPPQTGNVLLNPWADFNISGQFLCETFGLLAPGMPQTAARIGLHYTRVAIDGEPAQTTQMFTTMIATAYVENDVRKVMEAGIAALDPKSRMYQLAADMKQWHAQYPGDWRKTRQLLREKYTRENGKIRDTNGSELNTGAILGAMLYGEGDFSETVKLAFNFGWDADNNAAQVGTILGVIYGYRSMMANGWMIVDRYKNTTRDNMPMDETITSFADRLIELFEMVNESNGGSKGIAGNRVVYNIPVESPAAVVKTGDPAQLRADLLKDYPQEQIKNAILKGTAAEKAKAAYTAICLDLYKEIAQSNPTQWEEAKRHLQGYWKVMNNVFFGDFTALTALREKFVAAGVRAPRRKYTDVEIYNDATPWKDPNELYND